MKDPLTGEEFEPKRSNQRFATAKNRIRTHNEKQKKLRERNAFVNKTLRRNQMFLDDFMAGKNKATFHEEHLIGGKYNRNFFTGVCDVDGATGYCLYDYILIFEKPYVHVLRNERPF